MPFLAPLAPLLIGAAVGAGVAAATGGDIGKGALFGAIGGGVGAVAAPAFGITQAGFLGTSISPASFGAGVGGGVAGFAGSRKFVLPLGKLPKLETRTGTSGRLSRTTADSKERDSLRERLRRGSSRRLSRLTTPGLLDIQAPTTRPVLSDLL